MFSISDWNRVRTKCRTYVLIAVQAAFCSTTVYMESGEEYAGRISKVGPKVVVLQTDSSHTRTIPIAKIMALNENGNMVNGPFEYQGLKASFPDAIDAAEVGQDKSGPAAHPDSGSRLSVHPPLPDADTAQAHPDSVHTLRPHIKKDIFGYRFAIQAKPLNFLFSQLMANGVPFPARFAVARLRLVSFLALEAEPSLILGGVGGYSFLVGPAIMQTEEGFASNPVTVSLKYHYVYFHGWGNENAFLMEVTHQIIMQHLLVGFGGGLGVGLNGVTVTGGDDSFFESRKKIVEVSNGVFASLVFDMGFCL